MTQDIVGSKMPANNGYGQNGDSSPSSTTSVPASSKLTKFRASDGGAALDKLVASGMPDGLAAFQGPSGQERPISDTPFPNAHGQNRQQDPVSVFGKVAKELPQGDTYGDAQPMRKP